MSLLEFPRDGIRNPVYVVVGITEAGKFDGPVLPNKIGSRMSSCGKVTKNLLLGIGKQREGNLHRLCQSSKLRHLGLAAHTDDHESRMLEFRPHVLLDHSQLLSAGARLGSKKIK